MSETRDLAGLPVSAAVSAGDHLVLVGGAVGKRLPVEKLIASTQAAQGAVADVAKLTTEAAITSLPVNSLVLVYADPDPRKSGYWVRVAQNGNAADWQQTDIGYGSLKLVEPLVVAAEDAAGQATSAAAQVLDTVESMELAIGRASLYGIRDLAAARLFASNTLELAFSDGVYRDGFEAITPPDNGGAFAAPGWHFTRASAGTAEGATGLVSFAADLPRITNRGLLVERASIQAVFYSSAFTAGGDVNQWSGPNWVVADDGLDYAGAPAKRIAATAAGVTVLQANVAGVTSATSNTFWAVVKKGTGPRIGNDFVLYNVDTGTSLGHIQIDYDTGAITVLGGNPNASSTYLGDGWWKVVMTVAGGAAAGAALRLFYGFIGHPQQAGDFFRTSHVQVEPLPFASSRIVNNSGAAFERNADSARLAFDAPADFTLFAEVVMPAVLAEQVIVAADAGAVGEAVELLRKGDGRLFAAVVRGGVRHEVALGTHPRAGQVRAAITCADGVLSASVNGGAPVVLPETRPPGLARLWLGRRSSGALLDGHVRRALLGRRAASSAELMAMTAGAATLSLDLAPRTGHPLQGRYEPGAQTPAGEYGMLPVHAYGELPCGVLICELGGPSALAVGADGRVLWRDLKHLGRCVDVDPATGRCVVGGRDARDPNAGGVVADYRALRWLDPATGALLHEWTLPPEIAGLIYGFRITDNKLVVNIEGDAANCATHYWNLDAQRRPTGAPVALPFNGPAAYARSMLIRNGVLWVTATERPDNAKGWHGAFQAFNIATGAQVASFDSHYPNDIDLLPDGRLIGLDEHFERVRLIDPVALTIETAIASTEFFANYEPTSPETSYQAIITQRPRVGGSLSESAVEFAGYDTLYAPNGLRAITNSLWVIADTDNGRVVIVRRGADWRVKVIGIVALLNQPTKAVPMMPLP